MAASLPLDRLQRWMQAVIVHPGSAEQALRSPLAEAELEASRLGEVVLPSKTLSSRERIGIYQEMYPLRMEEALAVDYPALKHFLGERAFLDLVLDYVEACPSRSYTLNRLGDHLPEFVANAPGLKRREFCVDLARLELACNEVFDAPESRPLSEAEVAAVAPEHWEKAVVTPREAFRLLALRYNANDYLQSVKGASRRHPKPRLEPSWVAIFRRDYAVYQLDLTRAAHDLLADLAAGVPLGSALGSALKRGRRAPSQDELFRWFRQWVSNGMFAAVKIHPSP